MSKESTKMALENYLKKQIQQTKTIKPKNKKPEKELEKQMLPFLKSLGIFAWVVDSSAVYSASAGRYLYSQADVGCPDIIGVNHLGLFVAIELKSPGRRSSLKEHQRDFLTRLIQHNSFACCSDSVSHFSSLYSSWLTTPLENRQAMLMQDLPKQRIELGAKPLFED